MATRISDTVQPFADVPGALIDRILDLLPAAVYVCGADGRITHYNRKAVEFWGGEPKLDATEDRFCGAHRLFWSDGRPLPHTETPMAEALRSGQSARNLELQVERPDGTRLWALVNIDAIKDSAGNVTGAINCFQDITARKQAAMQVRQSQAFLRAVVETTPECIKVVARDGTLLQMNSAGLRMVGAENGSVVEGCSILDVIAPEYREQWKKNHERVCDGENLRWEFDIIGLGGSRRHMETHAAPLQMPDGTMAQLAITRDVTKRKQSEAARRESARRLHDLLEALPTAVYTTDKDGRITSYNQAAADFWGCRPELGKSEWSGSWRLYRVDGTPLPNDQCPMAVALKEQRAIRNEEVIAERPDGTRVPFMPYPTPLFDSSGALIGAVNMLVDITHHKQAHARQQLLINELNHRVKNTLATVQSIAAMTLRNASSPEGFRDTFNARLMALSSAHDLLTQGQWESASLQDLLTEILAPHWVDGAERIQLTGEDLSVPPRVALTLAMACHELATNAAKYGALSNAGGRLDIRWDAQRRPDAHTNLKLAWVELDGPPVKVPSRKGFGTRLVQRSVTHDLRGKADLEFAPEGLRCTLDIPLT